METFEDLARIAQKLMDENGFLIVASQNRRELGEVIETIWLDHQMQHAVGPVKVVGRATWPEYKRQQMKAGAKATRTLYYWKITIE